MINPERHGAVVIGDLPMVLTHVRTLESFDGPLLAEFRSETGDSFLYSWCDRDDDLDRWIVVRTPTQDITRYLVRISTLRDLITKCRDGFVYLVDLDRDDVTRAAFFIKVDTLPHEYVPTEQSFYQEKTAADGQQQDVFISDGWDIDQVNEYPRKYLQAYDFNALFGRHGDSRELRKIDYDLTTGHPLGQRLQARPVEAPKGVRTTCDERHSRPEYGTNAYMCMLPKGHSGFHSDRPADWPKPEPAKPPESGTLTKIRELLGQPSQFKDRVVAVPTLRELEYLIEQDAQRLKEATERAETLKETNLRWVTRYEETRQMLLKDTKKAERERDDWEQVAKCHAIKLTENQDELDATKGRLAEFVRKMRERSKRLSEQGEHGFAAGILFDCDEIEACIKAGAGEPCQAKCLAGPEYHCIAPADNPNHVFVRRSA